MGVVNFDNHPVFSKKYILKGEDEAAIRCVFKKEVLNFLEQKEKKINIEGEKNRIIYYRLGKRIKPMEYKSFIEDAMKIADLFDKSEF